MDKILGTIDNKQDEHGYMKIIRTIAPVGIGAFCIERFFNEQLGTTDFVVVYDCGKGRGAITSNPLNVSLIRNWVLMKSRWISCSCHILIMITLMVCHI